jgi:hypothetical protein
MQSLDSQNEVGAQLQCVVRERDLLKKVFALFGYGIFTQGKK